MIGDFAVVIFFSVLGTWGCLADNSKLPLRYRYMSAAALFLAGAGLQRLIMSHAGV